MMSDERLATVVRSWLEAGDRPPASVARGVDDAMARLPQIRRAGRPWPPLRQRAATSSAPAVRRASPQPGLVSLGPALERRFSMSGALKSFAALATVLLVGGLLVASLGPAQLPGGLAPGAPASPAAALTACPPGSTPDVPGAADAPRPPTSPDGAASSTAAFDRATGRIVLVADGPDGEGQTWLFDVCTNEWSRADPGTSPEDVGFAQPVYDEAADRTIIGTSGLTWAYDASADAWLVVAAEGRSSAGVPEPLTDGRHVYVPSLGRVVVRGFHGQRRMWSLDLVAGDWQPVEQATLLEAGPYPLHELLAYDRSVDRLVAFDLGKTAVFDFETGTWITSPTKSPVVGYAGYLSNGGQIVYDEAAERSIVVGIDGLVVAYDAGTDTWDTLFGMPSGAWATDGGIVGSAIAGRCAPGICLRHDFRLVYDPLNERIVVVGGYVMDGTTRPAPPADGLVAFDTRTREWIELLPPSQPVG